MDQANLFQHVPMNDPFEPEPTLTYPKMPTSLSCLLYGFVYSKIFVRSSHLLHARTGTSYNYDLENENVPNQASQQIWKHV